MSQRQALRPAVEVNRHGMRAFDVATEYMQSWCAGPLHLSEGEILVARHAREIMRERFQQRNMPLGIDGCA